MDSNLIFVGIGMNALAEQLFHFLFTASLACFVEVLAPSVRHSDSKTLSLEKRKIKKQKRRRSPRRGKRKRNDNEERRKEKEKEMEKEKEEAREKGASNVRLKEKLKKITHVHYKESHEGEIEESIEIDDKSEEGGLIEEVKGRMNLKFAKFETPDFYNSKMKMQLQHRHVTPPFVNGNFVYNPQEKSYENKSNI